MNMDFNLFMNDVVRQARQEITAAGYTELKTPEEVDEALTKKGTTLVMVNSVCGCAGGLQDLPRTMRFITISALIISSPFLPDKTKKRRQEQENILKDIRLLLRHSPF